MSGRDLRSLSPSVFIHSLIHSFIPTLRGQPLTSVLALKDCISERQTCTEITRGPSRDGERRHCCREQGLLG